MAYYATLRRQEPSHKQKHYKYREAPAATRTTPCSLSQQSVNSVSMFDLRKGHRHPVRPAPLPPKKSGTQIGTPTMEPIAENSGIHQKTSKNFLRMRKKLEARLTGCPTNSDDEEDEEVDEKHQRYVDLPRSQTLPRKLKLSTGKSSIHSSMKPPVYLIKGPVRQAPPPPKASKKIAYRKLPLPSTHRPAPPVPTSKNCHHPAPSPPSTATIPTKRPPPPPPSNDSSQHLAFPGHPQTMAAQSFQPTEAVPVYNAEVTADTTTAQLNEPGDKKAHYSQVMSQLLCSKPATESFSPMLAHSYREKQLPPATRPPLLPPLPNPPPPQPRTHEEDGLYDIPGYTLSSAVAETSEDDYTPMHAIRSVQPESYTYSKVRAGRNKPTLRQLKQEEGDTLYAQIQPAVHLPPLPSKQPPLGRVPLPPTSTIPTESDVYKDSHTGSGQIYDSVANN